MRIYKPAKKKEQKEGSFIKPPLLKSFYELEKRKLKKVKYSGVLKKKKNKDYVPGDCRYVIDFSTIIIPKTFHHEDGSQEKVLLAPCRVIQMMDYTRHWHTVDVSPSLF